MKFWAVLTTFLSTVAIVATFLTAPVEFSPNELNVKKNLTNYTGSFRAGFQKSSIFSYSNVKLYTFSPIENDKKLYAKIKRGANSFSQLLPNYDWNNIANQYIELFKQNKNK